MVGDPTALRGGASIPTRVPALRSSSRTAAHVTNITISTDNSSNNPNTIPPNSRAVKSATAASTNTVAVKARLTAPLQGRWTAQATAPELHGRRAAAWITIWDKGSAVRRISLLESLKRLHAESNSNALEDDLGDAAPLLFARLTSWWKLRYATWVADASRAAVAAAAAAGNTKRPTDKNGQTVGTANTDNINIAAAVTNEVSGAPPAAATRSPSSQSSTLSSSELLAQVEAITIFVRGSRFLLQFAEGGGAAALCDCLEVTSAPLSSPLFPPPTMSAPAAAAVVLSSPPDEEGAKNGHACERRAITLLLLHIANSGRVYREMVGEEENVLHLLHALLRETTAVVANLMTELLAVLGKGHPRLAFTVQTGLVRVLAAALPPSDMQEETTTTTETQDAATPGVTEEKPPHFISSPSASPSSARAPTTSEVVVLCAARAIRALQLQAEQQHYGQYPSAPNAGGGGASESIMVNTTSVTAGAIDHVPIIGLDATVTANSFAAAGISGAPPPSRTQNPLLRPFTVAEYLDTLFRLALNEQYTAFRVEGNELLNLAAKNIQLTPKILTRCLDVVEEDTYTLDGEGEGEGAEVGLSHMRLRRQRRQLSCGRAAVLILISRPMTSERRSLLLHLVAQRGGHFTLLKYLRLTQHGDTAAVVDCCHALQFVARASMELQRRRLGQHRTSTVSSALDGPRRPKTPEGVLLRMTEGIQSALGETVLQLLLFQELSEEDCMAILRSAHAAVVWRVE